VDGELTLREQDVAKSLTIKVQFMKQPLNFNQPSAVNLYWLQVIISIQISPEKK